MSLKLIRIARLKAFAASRNLAGPVAIGSAIGKKPNQVSDSFKSEQTALLQLRDYVENSYRIHSYMCNVYGG